MKHNSLESSTPAASTMHISLRLQRKYSKDGSWFVGRLPQIPGVFSQGATLEELEENIRDAYRMMLDEQEPGPVAVGAI